MTIRSGGGGNSRVGNDLVLLTDRAGPQFSEDLHDSMIGVDKFVDTVANALLLQ